MATIIRQAYIDKIEKYLGKETIIVLVGQRRVGKSYMMKTVRDQAVCLAWQKSDWKKTMPVNIRWTYSTRYC